MVLLYSVLNYLQIFVENKVFIDLCKVVNDYSKLLGKQVSKIEKSGNFNTNQFDEILVFIFSENRVSIKISASNNVSTASIRGFSFQIRAILKLSNFTLENSIFWAKIKNWICKSLSLAVETFTWAKICGIGQYAVLKRFKYEKSDQNDFGLIFIDFSIFDIYAI